MRPSCRQCSVQFEISDSDLAFYDKVSPVLAGKKELIPPPTLCPDCRQQRRMSYRNERQLYRRKCDVTGKNIISVFSPDSPFKVCDKSHWYGDAFDPFDYGRPFDSTRSFFTQFHELMLEIPLPSLRVEMSENCDFNNDMSDSANCYLCSRTHLSQNLLYTYRGNKSQDSMDCTQITSCSFLYGCTECVNCQDSRFLTFCNDCATCAFLLDCRGCMDCFLCHNLHNKRFCFGNQQLTKEAYAQRLKDFTSGSWQSQQEMLGRYQQMRHEAIRPARLLIQCENVSGDNMQRCKNCHDSFSVQECHDCRYLRDVKLHHDAMDEYSGGRGSELMYEVTSGSGSYGVGFSLRASNSQNVLYSLFTSASKYIFGCIGMRRSSYCILNKQYTKEEYEQLVPKIIERMRKDKEWGEFLPVQSSLFAYNETVANDHFPLTEEQVIGNGWRWKKQDDTIPDVQRIIPADQLPDSINDIPDDILNWAIRCNTTKRLYKVTMQELQYCRYRQIPIPREHPDVRYRYRMTAQNPFRLWERACAKCGKTVPTSFAPERPEIIYCEPCYLNIVY
jgi:hypothetical protein